MFLEKKFFIASNGTYSSNNGIFLATLSPGKIPHPDLVVSMMFKLLSYAEDQSCTYMGFGGPVRGK